MSMISAHTNKVHEAACSLSEMQRQDAVAAAKSAGSSAAIQAAVNAADVAHYLRIVASCKATNQPYAQFLEALRSLGVAS